MKSERLGSKRVRTYEDPRSTNAGGHGEDRTKRMMKGKDVTTQASGPQGILPAITWESVEEKASRHAVVGEPSRSGDISMGGFPERRSQEGQGFGLHGERGQITTEARDPLQWRSLPSNRREIDMSDPRCHAMNCPRSTEIEPGGSAAVGPGGMPKKLSIKPGDMESFQLHVRTSA